MIVCFLLVVLSVAYVAWNAFRHNPELVVMKRGWVLVTAFTGTIGLALHILNCKEPAPGTHEEFVRPLWKQGLGSATHCVAGDAVGIVTAAAVTGTLHLPMWLHVTVEYACGFTFELLVFRALFMKDMMGGSYPGAVRMSLVPEWLSMNLVMAGMLPVMVIARSHDTAAMEATSIRFWGAMSLAVLIGRVAAYPVNVWLVAKGLKHGMGTERPPGCAGLAETAPQEAMAVAAGYRAASHPAPSLSPRLALLHGMVTVEQRPTRHADMDMGMSGEHEGMAAASSITRPQLFAVALLTLHGLAAGIIFAALFGSL